jgi:RNA polymerase sigma-70 factor (ECF subfamily)
MTSSRDRLAVRLASDLDRAFPDFVRATSGGIYSGALQLTRNPHDAEDVTQETFVRAYRALGAYPQERIRAIDLKPWVWTIALNLCRNRARSRARHPAAPPGFDRADGSPDPADEAVALADLAVWNVRLAHLPAPQRTAIVLRHVVGLTYEEIASATGRTPGTSRSDVRRGLDRLRTLIEEER